MPGESACAPALSQALCTRVTLAWIRLRMQPRYSITFSRPQYRLQKRMHARVSLFEMRMMRALYALFSGALAATLRRFRLACSFRGGRAKQTCLNQIHLLGRYGPAAAVFCAQRQLDVNQPIVKSKVRAASAAAHCLSVAVKGQLRDFPRPGCDILRSLPARL